MIRQLVERTRPLPSTRFECYCERQRAVHGARFEAPTDARWIQAYNAGERYRIKVLTRYPNSDEVTERWGYVALTTGWAPSFMLMRRRGQRGSSDLIDSRDELVAAKWIK